MNKLLLILICMLTAFSGTLAQDKKPYIRIAKLEIDSAQLEPYKRALKEHAEAAVEKEPGVLTFICGA